MERERERVQRKLVAAAQTRMQREPRAQSDYAEQTFCPRCLAVLERGACPRCDRRQPVFELFCRRCLYVHTSTKVCQLWRPASS